jgi:hypothetical protein
VLLTKLSDDDLEVLRCWCEKGIVSGCEVIGDVDLFLCAKLQSLLTTDNNLKGRRKRDRKLKGGGNRQKGSKVLSTKIDKLVL